MTRPIPAAYRGSDTDRLSHNNPPGVGLPLLKIGQLFWTTDKKQLWVGDGVEVGGMPVSTSIFSTQIHVNPLIVGPVVAVSQATTPYVSLGSNQAIAVPICITQRDRLKAIYVKGVASGSTSQTAKLGIYSSGVDGRPYLREDDGGGSYGIPVNNTGMFTPGETLTAYLSPGVHWIVAILSNVTAAFTSKIAKYTSNETVGSLGLDSTGTKITHLHYTGGNYGDPLPDFGDPLSGNGWTPSFVTTGCPAMYVKFQ